MRATEALLHKQTIPIPAAPEAYTATIGSQLRAARVRAGFTLKEIAVLIGYTWVAVQRWEKDVCLPKPGVLLHLRSVYGAQELRKSQNPPSFPQHTPLRLHSRNTIEKPRRV